MEFKVCVGTEDRFNLLRSKIYEKILNQKSRGEYFYTFIRLPAGHSYPFGTKKTNIFNAWPEPELTFDQAMKLLDEIEPKFPFKFGEDVLVRDSPGDNWLWKRFVRFDADRDYPFVVNSSHYEQIAKLKGNEHLIMTNNTPEEYWIVEKRKLKKVEGGYGNVR